MHVVWFKRDLRVVDHAALTAAAACGPVLPLWVEEPEWLAAEDFDERHRRFAMECLAEVDEALKSRRLRVLAMRGAMVDCLERLWQATGFSHLWSHEETGNDWTYRRDLAVAAWCRARGVAWQELPQTGVVRRLKSRDGWALRWMERMAPMPAGEPERLVAAAWPEGLHEPEVLEVRGEAHPLRQRGGRGVGVSVLEGFLRERGVDFTRAMSSPVTAYDACSRISPYLTWGALSVREALHAAVRRQAELKAARARGEAVDARWMKAMESFTGRLRWHCHFMQKLEDAPAMEFENLARACDALDRHDPAWDDPAFAAWREGRTGYPMVDACMRALDATGWLNFRMRAMVMSFASHHLWLHWRKPGLHLGRMFLDYEPGIHWPQVQMQSGTTGINTLRVYSPAKQLEDQDPAGVFVRRWVPELRDVPDCWLARPELMPEMEQMFCGCRIGTDYPAPMVDHATAYRHAHDRIHQLRGGAGARAEAGEIQHRHGSRKRGRRSWR